MEEGNQSDALLEEETDEQTEFAPFYHVFLHNDDKNTMFHVVFCLCDVFAFSDSKAKEIMLEAHKSGVALCITEPFEYAETHCNRMLSYSLVATMEPVE